MGCSPPCAAGAAPSHGMGACGGRGVLSGATCPNTRCRQMPGSEACTRDFWEPCNAQHCLIDAEAALSSSGAAPANLEPTHAACVCRQACWRGQLGKRVGRKKRAHRLACVPKGSFPPNLTSLPESVPRHSVFAEFHPIIPAGTMSYGIKPPALSQSST